MSQTFELRLATDTLLSDALQLGVDPQQLQNINIKVTATLNKSLQLQLAYSIEVPNALLAAKLNWPRWQQSQVGFNDYLWEQTCLECFIAGFDPIDDMSDQTQGYIEINASPSGRYAIYLFNEYRKPAVLPPVALYSIGKTNKKVRANIDWTNRLAKHTTKKTGVFNLSRAPIIASSVLSKLIFTPIHCYKRGFAFSLNQLPQNLFANGIKQLHPCVILYFDKVALYFAANHAAPADFHQPSHWTRFYP